MNDWLTAILVIITGIYAFLTWKIMISNKKLIETMTDQFQETIRPYVTANLALSQGSLLVLEIVNRGRSPASNLNLQIDRDFYQHGNVGEENNIKNHSAFKKNTSTFSPGEKLVFSLFMGFEMDKYEGKEKNLTPKRFTITAKYNFQKTKYEERFTIDAGQYDRTLIVKSERDVLQNIEEHLKKLSNK